MKNLVYLILLSSIMIMGCAKPGPEYVNPEFHPYLVQLQQEATKRSATVSIPINIDFGDTSNIQDTVGLCKYDDRSIKINKGWWDNANEEQRFLLLAHEIGHCSLDMWRHNDNTEKFKVCNQWPETTVELCKTKNIIEVDRPVSLMNSRVIDAQLLNLGGDSYFDELMDEYFKNRHDR